jgi:hypothetical protein
MTYSEEFLEIKRGELYLVNQTAFCEVSVADVLLVWTTEGSSCRRCKPLEDETTGEWEFLLFISIWFLFFGQPFAMFAVGMGGKLELDDLEAMRVRILRMV